MHNFLFLAAIKLDNNQIGLPTSTTSIDVGLKNIVTILITLVGLTSTIFIIVAGLQMTLSAGSPQRFKQGRDTLMYAVIGVVVSIAAYAIVVLIADSVK